jgi:SH3-like domain-containing protein
MKFCFFIFSVVLFISQAQLLLSSEQISAQDSEQNKFVPVYATVLKDKVNIRAGQGVNFEILGQLDKNKQVVVVGQQYGWYKIKLPKNALSFVYGDYVDRKRSSVKVNRLRIRAGAGLNFNVLGTLKKGETVEVLEERGNWLRIAPPPNCLGWIKGEYLRLSKKGLMPIRTQTTLPKKKIAPTRPLITSTKKIEISGIIDELGKIINRQGTHKLNNNKKILYYLKSDVIDLNHYVYQKVRLKGQIEETKNSPYPVINVEHIIRQ